MKESTTAQNPAPTTPGPVVVITGAARGLGRAMAQELASRKARLVLSDILEEPLGATAVAFEESFGHMPMAVQCDVTNRSQVDNLATSALEAYGQIDVWINNAGIVADSLLIRMKPADFQRVFDVNVTGTFNGMQAAAKIMMRQRQGTILNIGSVSGFYGQAGQVNYSASKAAVHSMTRSAARELASRNVTVNCLVSGLVQNDFVQATPAQALEAITADIPLTYSTTLATDAVAKAAAFLVSEQARYITGTLLRVDGGLGIGF